MEAGKGLTQRWINSEQTAVSFRLHSISKISLQHLSHKSQPLKQWDVIFVSVLSALYFSLCFRSVFRLMCPVQTLEIQKVPQQYYQTAFPSCQSKGYMPLVTWKHCTCLKPQTILRPWGSPPCTFNSQMVTHGIKYWRPNFPSNNFSWGSFLILSEFIATFNSSFFTTVYLQGTIFYKLRTKTWTHSRV